MAIEPHCPRLAEQDWWQMMGWDSSAPLLLLKHQLIARLAMEQQQQLQMWPMRTAQLQHFAGCLSLISVVFQSTINRVGRSSVKFNGDEDGGSLLASLCFTVVGLNSTIVVDPFQQLPNLLLTMDSWP